MNGVIASSGDPVERSKGNKRDKRQPAKTMSASTTTMSKVLGPLAVLLLLTCNKTTNGDLVEIKMPSKEDIPKPPDFSKISPDLVLQQFGMPRKMIDPRGVDLMSLTKVCTPNWLNNDSSVWQDARCMHWPEVCDYMPSPPPVPFAVFTEMFPCFILDRSIMKKIAELQHATLTSVVRH